MTRHLIGKLFTPFKCHNLLLYVLFSNGFEFFQVIVSYQNLIIQASRSKSCSSSFLGMTEECRVGNLYFYNLNQSGNSIITTTCSFEINF